MKFKLIEYTYQAIEIDVIYLIYRQWDDYGYCTTFTSYYKPIGSQDVEELGTVKIGCLSLSNKVKSTYSQNNYLSHSILELMPKGIFNQIEDDFFSLGQDISYYKNVNRFFTENSFDYYDALKDLALNIDLFKKLYSQPEPCLTNSLMRNLHFSNVEQFNRIVKGEAELTEYSFAFKYDDDKININVIPNSLPPSNIHVLIGRNGVGKTWLLHNIVIRLLENSSIEIPIQSSQKYSISNRFTVECPEDSFAGILGLSFSVFDDALCIDISKEQGKNMDIIPNQKQIDDFNKKYKYIGLISKSQKDGKAKTKSVDDLTSEFRAALKRIKDSRNKIDIYLETCINLNTDPMFNDNGFINKLNDYLYSNVSNQNLFIVNEETNDKKLTQIERDFKKLSSGHMIIMLSLTLLAESIYEKTIVLIDEPETHLHPPLLSTYIRTLSFLLKKKNAVAIIATHSPIVLQEVPKDCVSRIERSIEEMHFYNIKIESFATSTDSLTREVFGLEVVKTGFYQLIEKELEDTFDKSFDKFNQNIGFLGQVLMQSLINKKGDTDEKNK